MTTRRALLLSAAALPAAFAFPAHASEPPVFSHRGYAIRGYDPVAYFAGNGPVRGDRAHAREWNGATWLFATAENAERFAASPEVFAPQYGGYCAWAVSQGYTASIDPDAWELHNGKLYLNYSRRVHRTWSRDIPGNVASGDANWPAVLSR